MLFACLLVGCGGGGPPAIPIEGRVINGDQPLTTGTVTFHPDTSKGNTAGSLTGAQIGADGSYEIVAPAGWYKVTVAAQEAQPEDGEDAYALPKYLVSEQYTTVENSPLSVEIKSGAAESAYDLKLTN